MESLISIENRPELAPRFNIVDRLARSGVRRRRAAIDGGAIVV
jgi:hypothetical protein